MTVVPAAETAADIAAQVLAPSIPNDASAPWSPVIVAGDWVFVSAQLAAGADGIVEEARINPRAPFYSDAQSLQSAVIYANLHRLLAAAGATIDDIVNITQWFTVDDSWRTRGEWSGLSITRYLEERNRHITHDRPASVGLGVRRLTLPEAVLAVDVVARRGQGGATKESIFPRTDKHQVLAGYTPAIRLGDWTFCSGEVPTDWKGDWLSSVHMGAPSSVAAEARVNPYQWLDYPIRRQTEYVLQKLAETAEAAGTRLENAVKARVYLVDPADFYGFEEVWRAWFPSTPPARTVLPYTGLGPVGARVEVALDLVSPAAAARRVVIETSAAPEPLTHQPQAVRIDDMLFFSGLLAHDHAGLAPAARVSEGRPYDESAAKKQLRYVLDAAAAICEAAGTSLGNLVRAQQFVTDMRQLWEYHEVWCERRPGVRPTGFTCELGRPLFVDECDILLDLTAYVPGAAATEGRV